MAPDGDKIRVTARISKELDTEVHRYYTNLAPAIIEGLELLVSMKEGKLSPNDTDKDTNVTGDLMARIGDMERQIEFLKRQIEIKDSQLEKQAYSLQSLIQVNSALNLKLLPESTPIQKEETEPTPRHVNVVKTKQTVEKVCENCNTAFTAESLRAKFCSGKCKTAFYRKLKK